MITHCFSGDAGLLELSDIGFIADTIELMKVVLPASALFTLWRIFVSNRTGPRGGVIVLGLDDSSKVYARVNSQITATRACLYLFTGLLTFCLGLLAVDVYRVL